MKMTDQTSQAWRYVASQRSSALKCVHENMQFLFDFISTERAKIFSSKCCQYGIMDLIDLESVNVLDHLFVSCPEVVAEIYGIFLEKLFGKLKYTLTHPKNIFVSH